MKSAWRTLVPYLRNYRRGLAAGVVALLLRNLFSAAVPLMIGYAVDQLTEQFTTSQAIRFAGLLILLTALKGLCQYWMRVTLIGISRDIEYDLRNDIFAHLISLSGNFFARYRTGDIMARATNDLNSVRMLLGPGIMYTADTAVTAVLAVVVMGSVDWRLTCAALLPAPLVSIMVVYFGRYIHTQFHRIQGIFSDISSRVQESLTGVRVIRAYVQEESEQEKFDGLNRNYIREALKLVRVSGFFMPALHSLTGISFLIVLWYGGYRLLQGQLTLGGFLMFNVYLGMLIWPMVAMGWVVNIMQRGTASLGRIREMLQETPGIADPERAVPFPRPSRGEIRFEAAGQRFEAAEALADINLQIRASSTVAVVGHTGSGKSSLVQLVPRLRDPSHGCVRLDGVDIRNLPLRQLRREIGYVPQETFLFSATLAENIAFGVPEATGQDIEWAADLAGLTSDIAGFPDGLATVVGERGITLSGGQKQRTAIARAVLRRPKILILDDALSSVDTETEERILTALADVMRDRTTILISHRVSTVRHAENIIVLERGRVAEQGTHEDLLKAGRWYADLYRRQLLEEELESV